MDTKIANPLIRKAARAVWLAVALLALGIVAAGTAPYARALSQVCGAPEAFCVEFNLLLPEQAAMLAELGVTLTMYAAITVAVDLAFKIVFATIGIYLFLRRSDDWMVLLVSLCLVTFGLATFSQAMVTYTGLAYPALELPARLLTFTGDVLIISFFLLFPGGQFAPRWTVWPGLVFVFASMMDYVFPGTFLDPDRWPGILSPGFFVFQLVVLIFTQIYRYRRVSNTTQRYQTRWVVAGMVGALSGLLMVGSSFLVTGSWDNPVFRLVGDGLIGLFISLIPVSLGIAVTRHRLWDVDFIIRRTLMYTALTIILAGLYVGLVLLFQQIVFGVFGTESQAGIVLSTLVIVVMVQPLRRRLQEWIDQRFYRRKYDSQRMLAGFSNSARNEVDPQQIGSELLEVVEEALQPESKALWLRNPR